LSGNRLASGFWIAAKLRQIQNAGGFASILVKGHDEAGAINLVLRLRDGSLKLAVPAIGRVEGSDERSFEWRGSMDNDSDLNALILRELRFDRDQWFLECELSEERFAEIFEVLKFSS
jgi:hypothetical protein